MRASTARMRGCACRTSTRWPPRCLRRLHPAELAAAGAILDYVELTQQGKMPRLSAPGAHRRRRDPGDRRRDPPQPRALAHARRRAAGQPARHHRPHRDRRRRTPAGDMAGRAPDRHRRHRRAPGCGRTSHHRDAAARRSARRISRKRAGPGARLVAPVAGPRRPARSRRHPRRPAGGGASIKALFAEASIRQSPPALLSQGAAIDLGHPCRPDRPPRPRAWPDTLPLIARDGGFIAAATCPNSTSGALAARRFAQADPGAGGALSRRSRHRLAQDQAQQRPGLFRRGDHDAAGQGEGSTPASSSANRPPTPPASPPSSWASWRPRSRKPPTRRWRWSCACSPIWSAKSPRAPTASPRRPARWR